MEHAIVRATEILTRKSIQIDYKHSTHTKYKYFLMI